MAETTEQHIKRIQDKLQQVLKRFAVLQKENQSLKEELNSNRRNSLQYQENAEQLKQKIEILKYSGGEMGDAEKKQFEKRINTYLKEIDRCIVMLGE
ncbi:MAG: hypothetical protein WDN26_17945 [Chitinophagaceae bacterium]